MLLFGRKWRYLGKKKMPRNINDARLRTGSVPRFTGIPLPDSDIFRTESRSLQAFSEITLTFNAPIYMKNPSTELVTAF